MADRPVVPPKRNVLPMKLHAELDYPEHCHSPLDADHFYDCMEEIDNRQTQNHTTQPPAPANPLPQENMCNYALTVTNLIQSAENSDGQMGNEHKNVENSNGEEELSEVLKKLVQYGEEIRACARQCGISADSFDCIAPECTGTEPCLEPFVASSENPEPTARGDTDCGSEESEQSNASRSTVLSLFGLPGEDVWCSATSSPRSIANSDVPFIDTIQSLRLDNLEEYFRENPAEEDRNGKVQLRQSSDKQAYRCMKKSKSDSEVQGLTFQKSEEEGYETDSSGSSSSGIERQQSSTEWSTLSCHTVSTPSDDSVRNEGSNSLAETQEDYLYQDDIDDLEGRPDAGGDGGGSHISIHVTEDDEGIYEYDADNDVFVTAESGDQDSLDSSITYNFNAVTQNRLNVPLRLTLTTEQMLDELFPAVRLQPRPIRVLQALPDHPVSENTTGGGEGDFELGRRIVVQSFFVEDASPPQEADEGASWTSTGFDISRDSLHEILRWTTIAGFCASVFLIWQFHNNSR